jgi:LysR family transcriptional regulator, transcription activator of glutamate synthase operon
MTLKGLMIFAAAARHLNLTKAAKELHISQPSASRQLRLLEKICEVKLYKRIGRGIALTEQGESFLSNVNAVLTRLENLKSSLHAADPPPGAGSLAVGGTYGPSAYLLPSLIAAFRKSHPQVQISLRTGTLRSIEKMILDGKLDISVVTTHTHTNFPRIDVEPYRIERLVAFVTADHAIAKKTPTLSDLNRTPLIIRGQKGTRTTTEAILKQLREAGFKPHVGLRCDLPDGVKMAVRKKLGIGILYYDAVRVELRRDEFQVVKLPGPKLEGESFIIYPKERPLTANAEAFLKLLHDWRRKNQHRKPPLPKPEKRSASSP